MPLKKPLSSEQALMRLEGLCAVSEQCTAEMYAKLRSYGIIGRQADGIVQSLVDNRYVDDCRFAHAYVRDKFRFSRWGRRKIQIGLMQKRIARKIVRDAMESEIDEEEYRTVAAELIRAKTRQIDLPMTYADSQKLLRFMLSRGFEPNVVFSVIRNENLADDNIDGYDDTLMD